MSEFDANEGAPRELSEPPRELEEICARISHRRWRIYETTRHLLEELESRLDWEAIYAVDAPLERYLEWGLYLEEAVPRAGRSLRESVAGEDPPGARPEAAAEELEDHLYWGMRQVESGLEQPLSVLRREMVDLVTGGVHALPEATAYQKKRALAMPMAEVAGKMRHDLRKFTTFLISSDEWDPDDLELLLFPAKHEELARGQRLKEHLVEVVESFHGTSDRLPIARVIQMWRHGEVHGQAALAEIDLLLRRLGEMLAPEDRMALYVDSYYRLLDWLHHLETCSRGLRDHLGDAAIEETLIREIAAILDSELLAEILGESIVAEHELPRDAEEKFLPYLSRRAIAHSGLKKAQRERLLELKDYLGQVGVPDELMPEDAELLRVALARIRGQKRVDLLRLNAPLDESMRDLEHLHPVVLESEDGLRTYLTLLYGQIQNRDLHLLRVDPKDIPMAEKRLAVRELEYRLELLRSEDRFQALVAARQSLGEKEEVEASTWEDFRLVLSNVRKEVVPRLVRLCTFAEISGMAPDDARAFERAVEQLDSFEEPPAPGEREAAGELLARLAVGLEQIDGLSLAAAPPQTEAEIEQFLDMLG